MDIITLEAWEDSDYVICINSKPVGGAVSKSRGESIREWLNTAIREIKGIATPSIQEVIETLRKSNPYPDDIFIEPTKEQYALFHKLLKEHGLTLDKFMGAEGRRVWNLCVDKLGTILKELEFK